MTIKPRRILETALYCDRLAPTAAFYQRLLEPVVLLETERLVALDAGGGTVLLLFQRGQTTAVETPLGVIPAHDGSPAGHVTFAIGADELAAWEAKLVSLGIPIESRVGWPRGGTSLYFRDPEGRLLELATPGLWITY